MRGSGFFTTVPLLVRSISAGQNKMGWTFTFKLHQVCSVRLIATGWAGFISSSSCLGYTWHIYLSWILSSHFYVQPLSEINLYKKYHIFNRGQGVIFRPLLRLKAVILYLYSFTRALLMEDLLGSPDRHLLQQVQLPGLIRDILLKDQLDTGTTAWSYPGYIVERSTW